MDTHPLSCILSILCAAQGTTAQAAITVHTPSLGSYIAIAIALVGLLLSAFNSGSEIAYFSLTREDIEKMPEGARRDRITSLLSKPEQLLATILIGNNLVNVMIVIVLNYAMTQIFTFNSTVADFVVQTVILTFLILLFGEVMPKLYARNNNVKFAQMVAAPLEAATRVFAPLAKLMVKSTYFVNHVVSKKADSISMDDLSKALDASDVKRGSERDMLQGILKFGDKSVSEIMRPRVDVVDLDYEDKFDDVVKTVVDNGYSRMPVYEENPDNIRGILYAKDLLPYIGKRDNSFRWQTLLRPAFFVPETRMIDDLLEDFRRKKMHLAIVVDEFGCTQGIVTMEDVLEEIVGDIDDEYDTEEKSYTKLDDSTYVFDGKTQLADFERIVGATDDELDDVSEDVETIAGLLLNLKGDFMRPKETLNYGRFEFTVMKVEKYRIATVKVHVLPKPSGNEEKKD